MQADTPSVSVIIPSFNRANLLERTLPSYLNNDSIIELLLIDDGSVDDTSSVVARLQQKYPQLKYIRLAKNSRQPFAKNVGIANARGRFIYFGDDDSFMQPGAIDQLLATMQQHSADIVGARALYLDSAADIENLADFVKAADKRSGRLYDFEKLSFKFYLNPGAIIAVPVCQACFIINKQLAEKIKFDVNYTGNAFREETDFLLRATVSGVKIVFNPTVIQFNLPREQAKNGAHSMSLLKYRLNCIRNNWYFLQKNRHNLAQLKVKHSIYYLQGLYLCESLFHLVAIVTPRWIKKSLKHCIG